jgi:pimeloyl-ACP methyl ester carboxylesterase
MGMEVHQAIPGSKFYVIPNTGHTLNLENVKLVAEKISENIA